MQGALATAYEQAWKGWHSSTRPPGDRLAGELLLPIVMSDREDSLSCLIAAVSNSRFSRWTMSPTLGRRQPSRPKTNLHEVPGHRRLIIVGLRVNNRLVHPP